MNPNETAEIETKNDGKLVLHRSQVVTGMFFLTNDEANKLSDPYVTNTLPHYLMSDGTVRFGKTAGGSGAGMDIWWEESRTADDYKENGYGPKERQRFGGRA